MSQQPNDQTGNKAYQTNVSNMPTPPELQALLTRQAAINQQIANTPSNHPTFASLQSAQATVAAAVAAFKGPRDDAR